MALRDVAGDLAALLRAATPRAGRTRVIAIDGRSGAGKTTLAALVAEELGGAPVVSLEYLYDGWDGLRRGIGLLAGEVLAPLAAGRTALVPRYDWTAGAWSTPVELSPPEVLVVEGVGAGARPAAPYVSVLAWLEADRRTRERRALARDGETYRPHWARWAAQEDALFAGDPVQDRADVIVRTDAPGGSTIRRPAS